MAYCRNLSCVNEYHIPRGRVGKICVPWFNVNLFLPNSCYVVVVVVVVVVDGQRVADLSGGCFYCREMPLAIDFVQLALEFSRTKLETHAD